MIKTFCDACGAEITHENRMFTMVEVTHPKTGSSLRRFNILPTGDGDQPDVCQHCVIDVVNKLDHRPQLAAPEYEEAAVVSAAVISAKPKIYEVDASKTELRVGDILYLKKF